MADLDLLVTHSHIHIEDHRMIRRALRIRAVMPVHLLLAYIKYESRGYLVPDIRPQASFVTSACVLEGGFFRICDE